MVTPSPDRILLTRMNMHIPADAPTLSVLHFPFAKAFTEFYSVFKQAYQYAYPEDKYTPRLPRHTLNGALLALAPSLIHGFETKSEWNFSTWKMAAFTRCEDDGRTARDFPSVEQMADVITLWLGRWSTTWRVEEVLKGDAKDAWKALLEAVANLPETEWQHDISITDYLTDIGRDDGMAYRVLPALFTRKLHGTQMSVSSEHQDYLITWRRAHDSADKGLYVVSQPIRYGDDCFAYRLDFRLETQTGRVNEQRKLHPWMFVKLSIQRYVTDVFRKGNDRRNGSILVGNNQERLCGWDEDTTLVRLPIRKQGDSWTWADGIGELLDTYALRRLLPPDTVVQNPVRYGNYEAASALREDEYRIVYAEGYKFGKSKKGRNHQVDTGTSLLERARFLEGVLGLLDGWLEKDTSIPLDFQTPGKRASHALMHHGDMIQRDVKGKKKAAWCAALALSLKSSGHEQVQIAILCRTDEFRRVVQAELDAMLIGAHKGDTPLVTIMTHPISPLLTAPLDPGDPDNRLPDDKKSYERRKKHLRQSYDQKCAEWSGFLAGLGWHPNARRLAMIDSEGIDRDKMHPDQSIKGAVRDACHRQDIQSQFLIGNFKKDNNDESKLKPEAAGRVTNAVGDLVVRQQAILYAPPTDLYLLAGVDRALADKLDVIAFCRLEKKGKTNLHYALAVRLRADGAVHVMLPDGDTWLAYGDAMHQVGHLFSKHRFKRLRGASVSSLNLESADLREFAQRVFTTHLDLNHLTLAVIEAAAWRNAGGYDESKHGWGQLKNENLASQLDHLRFTRLEAIARSASEITHLLGVIRLRKDDETPQYITADHFASTPMRDMPHAAGYVDETISSPFHYFSAAALPNFQKEQANKKYMGIFKGDVRDDSRGEFPFKHPQLIEMVPFFVRDDFRHDEGLRQLCRCVHLLRHSPSFAMGDLLLPYPMHLGQTLLNDQLCIVDADD
ncbi:MAG: DUF3962 domain-containing protein [bacterium]|nr:DUF3962 domain-containing protein [bacterium]